jgi:serine/threonine protein kinase
MKSRRSLKITQGESYRSSELKVRYAAAGEVQVYHFEVLHCCSCSELQLGLNLGKGEFGIVREIAGIKDAFGTFGAAVKTGPQNEPIKDADKQRVLFQSLTRKKSMDTTLNEESLLPLNDEQDPRTFMSQRCFRGGKPRYAVKQVRNDLSSDTYFIAALDLAAEAKFLASIQHSNIVRLRATVDEPGSESFMIVLDRLYMMLSEKIVEWRKRERKCRGPFRMMIFRKEMHLFLMVERLVALFDIARALKYLHENKIMYRDLKPE